MKLTQHNAPEDLLRIIEPLLLAKESENNLFLGLLIQFTDHPEQQEDDHFWFSIVDQGKILLAGWRTPPFPFGIWAPDSNYEPALQHFIEYLKEKDKEVPGIVARKDLADRFREMAQRVFQLETFFTMKQGLYECREVDTSRLGNGSIRLADETDLELLTDWNIAFYIDVLKTEPLRSETKAQLTEQIHAEVFYLYEVGGEIVSMAFCARPMINGITVNMVYTPKHYRNKGYATACVAQLTKKLLEDGWEFTALYTDLNNPTSNNIYKKIGYRWIGESAEYRFKPLPRNGH